MIFSSPAVRGPHRADAQDARQPCPTYQLGRPEATRRAWGCVVVALAFFWCAAGYAGEQPKRLTTDGRMKFDPCFTSGGEQVVYTVEEKPNQRSLMRLQLADGSVERLHAGISQTEFSATYSADGRYYAWCHNNGNLHIDLMIRDTQSAATATFNAGGGFAGVRSPSFAPDGSRVVFALPENGFAQQIFSVDAKGENRVPLMTDEGFNMCPEFAQSGRQIAFASTRDGNFEIYTMSQSGAGVRRLTDHPSLDIRPAWSPDDRHIAFTSLRDGNYEIYVMNADGSDVQRVTHDDERDDYAYWHPDGRQLLIVSERRGRHDLYLVDVPGLSS